MQMTQATPQDYWISPNALYVELNALGEPDFIQASCVSGAQILVYIKDIITYDAGHNYRRWNLQASPTIFNTHSTKYVYAAIPRSLDVSKPAYIVFPSITVDIYGKTEMEEQIGSTNYYYIFLQGIITSSGVNGSVKRYWRDRIVTGYLSSDEALNAGPKEAVWYKYSTVDGILTFIKDLTMKAGTTFLSLFAKDLTIVQEGALTFEGKEGSLTGITTDETPLTSTHDAVTPQYLEDSALSKKHDDSTAYDLAMKNLTVRGNADFFGNTILHGELTVGTVESPQNTHLNGNVTVGTYNKGIQGANIDFYGNAEFESIVGRSFLEVPELRYNRTTITVGNKWQTQGAGIIEKVWQGDSQPGLGLSDLDGVAKLKLEKGEIGAIAVDDKCQGVFHFVNKENDTTTSDPKNGNYHFAGFTTIYFLVKEIYTAESLPDVIKEQLGEGETIGDNQFFRYELRAKTCASLSTDDRNCWTDASHPQPAMLFAAYANETNSDRQASRLTTTTYQLHLAGMTDWTYTQDNIRLIIGWLNGFSVLESVWDKEQKKFVQANKEFSGEGIATGNIYMWGAIDQFDRVPYIVSQQSLFQSSDSLDEQPDGVIVPETHLSYDLNGWQKEALTPTDDNRFVWQQWLYTYSDGTYDVSEVTFYTAYFGDGYTMEIDQDKGGFLAPRETETVTCTIYDALGKDVTSTFVNWSIARDSGDKASDAVWNTAHQVATNPFSLSFADLNIDGINITAAKFTVTATDATNEETATTQLDFFI